MFGWLWSQIPWYVPVVAIVIAVILCWQWIAPIWFMLPRWLQTLIGAIALVLVAVQYGRNRGIAASDARRKSLNEKAVAQRETINAKVRNMPPNAVSDALRRNGWMRND